MEIETCADKSVCVCVCVCVLACVHVKLLFLAQVFEPFVWERGLEAERGIFILCAPCIYSAFREYPCIYGAFSEYSVPFTFFKFFLCRSLTVETHDTVTSDAIF